MKKYLCLVLVLILSACLPVEITSTSTPTTKISVRTATQSPTQTPTEKPSPTTTPEIPTITPVSFEVCSPLEEETFESLPAILVNPLNIPPFGQDIGHHGVDFAYYRRGDRVSIQGIEIYTILSGSTVLTLGDDIPYGYTILIETPLSDLPLPLHQKLLAGYQPVPEDPYYRLSCPEVKAPTLTGELSVYHLYAHMEIRPSFKTGDPIPCGTMLGNVGNSGFSSNPHLHLETRLGPSGADFKTMAHYENTNTIEQMATYCLWRMSGYYQLFDPFLFFDDAE